jgi:7-cyano-7-deazaguanine synthase
MNDDISKLFPSTDDPVLSVLSGGLDSTVLTYALCEKYGANKVYTIAFDYNQKQREELNRAAQTASYLNIAMHKVVDLTMLGDIARGVSTNISGSDIDMPTIKDVIGNPQPVTYIPYRNMILNSIAMSYAESIGAQFIFTGVQSTDEYGYWDTTKSFVDSMNSVSALNRKKQIRLVAPFGKLSKEEEIAIALQLNTPVKFEHTLTCYNPNKNGESCGICPSCAERLNAFIKNKVRDPVAYSVAIPWEKFGL